MIRCAWPFCKLQHCKEFRYWARPLRILIYHVLQLFYEVVFFALRFFSFTSILHTVRRTYTHHVKPVHKAEHGRWGVNDCYSSILETVCQTRHGICVLACLACNLLLAPLSRDRSSPPTQSSYTLKGHLNFRKKALHRIITASAKSLKCVKFRPHLLQPGPSGCECQKQTCDSHQFWKRALNVLSGGSSKRLLRRPFVTPSRLFPNPPMTLIFSWKTILLDSADNIKKNRRLKMLMAVVSNENVKHAYDTKFLLLSKTSSMIRGLLFDASSLQINIMVTTATTSDDVDNHDCT